MWNYVMDRDESLHPSSSSSNHTFVVRDMDIPSLNEDDDNDSVLSADAERKRKCLVLAWWVS
jgi:hypothetical protein